MASATTIDVKEAVITARNYFAELFGDAALSLQLEEVDPQDQDGGWRITFSYERPGSGTAYFVGRQPERVYKVVTLNASGQAISIKSRE